MELRGGMFPKLLAAWYSIVETDSCDSGLQREASFSMAPVRIFELSITCSCSVDDNMLSADPIVALFLSPSGSGSFDKKLDCNVD
jgi:hypothetical protein